MVSSLLPWWPKTWNPFNRWQWSNGYDYETYLSSLADEIESVESTILDIKARKRRTIHNVLQVMLTLWIISLVILWAFSSFIWGREWAASRSMFVVLLLLGTPLFIAVLHRLVTIWFRRLERAQESHLATLRKQQRSKINEIKKATDFEHLRSLLERYDTDSSAGSSFASGVTPTKSLLSRRSTTSLRKKTSKEPSRLSKEAETSASSAEEQAKKAEVLKMLAPPITSTPVQNVPSTTSGSSATRPTAMGVHPRGWMDKVADMILGTDPYGVTLEDQQYALICRNCFRHNGLVPKSELDEIQYICPHCHAFNSRRPSSRPVSSPFARAPHDMTPVKEKRPTLPTSDDIPDTPTTKPEDTHSPSLEPARRSARLKSQRSSDDAPSTEDMQVDDE